jgi:hypothetical protein
MAQGLMDAGQWEEDLNQVSEVVEEEGWEATVQEQVL